MKEDMQVATADDAESVAAVGDMANLLEVRGWLPGPWPSDDRGASSGAAACRTCRHRCGSPAPDRASRVRVVSASVDRTRMILRRSHTLRSPPANRSVRESSQRPSSACSVSMRRASLRETVAGILSTRYSY